MSRSLVWVAALGAFALVLLYTTLVSLPESPPTGADHTAEAAAAECVQSVDQEVQEARFPFPATVTYLGDARYRLNGTVETTAAVQGEVVRRNYECVVRYSDADRYQTDSVTVWQSH
jgi:hypothetical protein